MGMDQLPEKIRNSRVLSGNDLGMLANLSSIPEKDPQFQVDAHQDLHQLAKNYLSKNQVMEAWQVLLGDL
jgi:hypothetical protein